MKKCRLLLCLLLVLSLMPLCGCSAGGEEITVVASFYPVYILAQNVVKDVENLTLTCMTAPATGCLHDYQLLTSDMRALSGARAFLINGAGMESFLPDVMAQFPALPIIDCSQHVPLIADDDDAPEEAEENGHHHGEGWNAHIWLDPQNAILMVENIRDGLAALLPEQAEKISQNAAAYTAELEKLDQELRGAIALLPQRQIVTFHEAFSYFAKAYGLQVVAVVTLEPEEPLSPKMLKHVVQAVQEAGCPPLFSEPQYENAALKTISEETGAKIYELDPLVTGDGAWTAYQDGMRKNLEVLQSALQ